MTSSTFRLPSALLAALALMTGCWSGDDVQPQITNHVDDWRDEVIYQLLTDRNVFDNLYYVMKATGWKRDSDIRERIDEVLKQTGLESKDFKMPFELSGGEQQRLVIARALLNKPSLILADEPTGNLDPVTADGIIKLFQSIAKSGCAVVMSTHNTAIIEDYPSRTLLFSQGKIREIDLNEKLGC